MAVEFLDIENVPNRLFYPKRKKRVTFVVGSGLTLPTTSPSGDCMLGVSGCSTILERILAKLEQTKVDSYLRCVRELRELPKLDSTTYPAFFEILAKHEITNDAYLDVIREAVLQAFTHDDERESRISSMVSEAIEGDRDACLELEVITSPLEFEARCPIPRGACC
jgi:hypothetical protein